MRLSSFDVEGALLLWEVFDVALGAGVTDLESLLALPEEESADDDDCCCCWSWGFCSEPEEDMTGIMWSDQGSSA
jgi:hypothetical protein